MIIYRTGDLFKSDADCLINTVNCEGYMGKGIAYQFKLKYPENNKQYVKACKDGSLRIGKLNWCLEDGKIIINFPTKNKWREKSLMEYIEAGLDELIRVLPSLEVNSIAVPPLGCGNGGLIWKDVKILLENKLSFFDNHYTFYIYEPSTSYKQIAKKAPSVSTSGLILMEIKMHLEKFNSLRLQKAAFFTNIFLQEEYFKFDKYKFGPYAYSIVIISKSIKEFQDFYNIKDTKQTYDMVYKIICSEKTNKSLERIHPAVLKAAQYVNQIKQDIILEGVSTVLYLVKKEEGLVKDEIIDSFQKWSDDKKKRFSKDNIIFCIDYLESTGIIEQNMFGEYGLSTYV